MIPFIVNNDQELMVILKGTPRVVNATHPRFAEIKDALKTNSLTEEDLTFLLEEVLETKKVIEKFSEGKLVITENEALYAGRKIPASLAEKILYLRKEGYPFQYFYLFLENLFKNPSFRAVTELYGFLDKWAFAITEDGCFLAYKKVREDYTDIHSGTFNNSVGEYVSVARNEVDENSERTCSTGLHVCSYNYLPQFGSDEGDRVVIVKVNPKDVVAIPKDYNDAKMRCCAYEVVGELEDWKETQIKEHAISDDEIISNYNNIELDYAEDYDNDLDDDSEDYNEAEDIDDEFNEKAEEARQDIEEYVDQVFRDKDRSGIAPEEDLMDYDILVDLQISNLQKFNIMRHLQSHYDIQGLIASGATLNTPNDVVEFITEAKGLR